MTFYSLGYPAGSGTFADAISRREPLRKIKEGGAVNGCDFRTPMDACLEVILSKLTPKCIARISRCGRFYATKSAQETEYRMSKMGIGSPSDVDRCLATRVVHMQTLCRSIDIAAGALYTAFCHDGCLFAWGCGFVGQLGHGLRSDAPTPKAVRGLGGVRVRSVCAGMSHTMATDESGNLYSWGFCDWGELGRLDEADDRSCDPCPARVDVATSARVVAATVACNSSAAITSEGCAYVWGRNDRAQLGVDLGPRVRAPHRVRIPCGTVPLVSISAGSSHFLVLSRDGNVYSWGDGTDGKLGHGGVSAEAFPREVAGLPRVVQVSAGSQHSLAVTAQGAVLSWGRGADGRLGHGDECARATPTRVNALENEWVLQADAGCQQTAFLLVQGSIMVCGDDGNGILQDASRDRHRVPLVPTHVRGTAHRRFVRVAVGHMHCVAVEWDGESAPALYGWGVGCHGDSARPDASLETTAGGSSEVARIALDVA